MMTTWTRAAGKAGTTGLKLTALMTVIMISKQESPVNSLVLNKTVWKSLS